MTLKLFKSKSSKSKLTNLHYISDKNHWIPLSFKTYFGLSPSEHERKSNPPPEEIFWEPKSLRPKSSGEWGGHYEKDLLEQWCLKEKAVSK